MQCKDKKPFGSVKNKARINQSHARCQPLAGKYPYAGHNPGESFFPKKWGGLFQFMSWTIDYPCRLFYVIKQIISILIRIPETLFMIAFFYSLIVIFAWGSWIAVVQTIPFKNQQIKIFYISVANLILAFGVALYQKGPLLQRGEFIFPFSGGLLWAISGYFAFLGTENIGLAKAQGIWAPINILISIVWGMVLFGEFLSLGPVKIGMAAAAVGCIIMGILFIVTAGDEKTTTDSGREKNVRAGYIGALGAGILWGSYFVPVRVAGSSMWSASFPMAMGIFCASLFLFLMSGQSLILRNISDYVRVFLSGILWGVGNYGSLKLMELIGTGKGFTISQAAIVLSAGYSVFLFKNPPVKSRGAFLIFIGIALSLTGSILLGNIS